MRVVRAVELVSRRMKTKVVRVGAEETIKFEELECWAWEGEGEGFVDLALANNGDWGTGCCSDGSLLALLGSENSIF